MDYSGSSVHHVAQSVDIIQFCDGQQPRSVRSDRFCQQGVVGLRVQTTLEFIAQNSAFYRPDHLSDWSIIHHVTDMSLPVT